MAGMMAVMSTAAVPAFVQEAAGQYQYPGSDGGPAPGTSATFAFELAVECEPPEGATFLGQVPAESLIPAELTDPDGDGVYEGSITVPKFAPGGPPEPVSLPVRIVQGPPTVTGPLGPEYRVIEDFGTVVAEDRTFEASVSFCDDGGDDNNGGAAPVVSGDTNDDGGSVVRPGGQDDGANILPATGGVTLAAAVGALLIAAGLLARRIIR